MSSHDKPGEVETGADTPCRDCSAAEITASAHLYRGEIYRSTVWRTRLDSTTNWAVVTTGIALSATFSSAEASPLLRGYPVVLNTHWSRLLARDPCQPRFGYLALRRDQHSWRHRQSLIAIG